MTGRFLTSDFLKFFSKFFFLFGEFFWDADFGFDEHIAFGFEESFFSESFSDDSDFISDLGSFWDFDFHLSFWVRDLDFAS